MELNKLVRPNIMRLQPYSSARSEFKGKADVFLDANENPFDTGLNRYPDPLQWQLKTAVAALRGVAPRQIFLGNGSDEVIDLLIRIFCEPRRDHIIILPPTYGMYQVSADIADVEVRKVSLTAAYQPDVDAILAAADEHSKLLFLCSPNNPTGNTMDREQVGRLLDAFPGIVVVDEAYADFSDGQSLLRDLDNHPRLVVMQTFSKAWGLAGIRLGMAFAHPEIIDLLNKVKPPYNINQLTQQTALQALSEPEKVQDMISRLLRERAGLEKELAILPYVKKVHPSEANFLLVVVDDPLLLYNYLVEQKIIVRNRSNVHLCEGALRISIGRPEENRRLLEAMRQFAEKTETL